MREIELTVAAKDVRSGDRICAKVPEQIRAKALSRSKFQWSTVTGTRRAETAHRVILTTHGYETWKRPDEAVAIRRLERHGL